MDSYEFQSENNKPRYIKTAFALWTALVGTMLYTEQCIDKQTWRDLNCEEIPANIRQCQNENNDAVRECLAKICGESH